MSIPVYIGVTLFLFGGAGYMTGQAIALTWRPVYQAVIYSLLLGVGDRFIVFALFDGQLLSFTGYLIDTVTILVVTLVAFRVTRVKRMVSQYPWIYRRSGLFSWAELEE